LKSLHIRGRVFSGNGEGARFIELPWVKRQIEERLGFTPHLGTLNLKIEKDSLKARTSLEEADGVEVLPAEGFSRGSLFKASLGGNLECAIVIPHIPNYPEDVIEIIASKNLREKLKLHDGESVQVEILIE
jgi:riboflavin kinase